MFNLVGRQTARYIGTELTPKRLIVANLRKNQVNLSRFFRIHQSKNEEMENTDRLCGPRGQKRGRRSAALSPFAGTPLEPRGESESFQTHPQFVRRATRERSRPNWVSWQSMMRWWASGFASGVPAASFHKLLIPKAALNQQMTFQFHERQATAAASAGKPEGRDLGTEGKSIAPGDSSRVPYVNSVICFPFQRNNIDI